MKGSRSALIFAILILNGTGLFAQSQGEKLFKENNPADAVQVLENEISNGIVSENTYNFLGLGYYQLQEYEKSVKAFQRGIDVQPGNLKILSYNQGNSYFALKDYKAAVECYSRALQSQPDFYEALLNRANSLLMNDQLRPARSDYADFLEKNPDNPQSARIEQLIAAIDEELARREEEERLARERERALWEEFDASPEEVYYGPDGAEWERFDDKFEEGNYRKRDNWETYEDNFEEGNYRKKENWEQFEADSVKKLSDGKTEEKVDWESLDGVAEGLESEAVELDEEKDKAFWESIDEKERELLQKLDEQGVEEYKRRKELLLEQARLEAEEKDNLKVHRNGTDGAGGGKNGAEAAAAAEAAEAARKKRLDDLVNSLQNPDVTNVSSGADGLIEYEMEGELD